MPGFGGERERSGSSVRREQQGTAIALGTFYYKAPTNPAADNLPLLNRDNKMNEQIAAFLAGKTFAVVGASTDRQKFGNKILRCYMDNGFTVSVSYTHLTLPTKA